MTLPEYEAWVRRQRESERPDNTEEAVFRAGMEAGRAALLEDAEHARAHVLLMDNWPDLPALQDEILYHLERILGPLPGDALTGN